MEHPPTPNEEKYLTVEQVMDRLHVSRATVIRAINRGDLRAKKVGRVWRISEQWLHSYMYDEPQEENNQ